VLSIHDIVFNADNSTPENVKKYTTVVLGIDGAIQYILGTYDHVADLLESSYEKRNATDDYDDGNFYIEYSNNGEIVETIQVPEIVWALLMSDCDVIELVRDATVRKTKEEIGDVFYVESGWPYRKVGEDYQITPPEGWAAPTPLSIDEQYASISEMVTKVENYLILNPSMIPGHNDNLIKAKIKQAELLAKIEERDGQQ
jgi:hypothetical protein